MTNVLDSILQRHFMNRDYERFAKYARNKLARMKRDREDRDRTQKVNAWRIIQLLPELRRRHRIESKDRHQNNGDISMSET